MQDLKVAEKCLDEEPLTLCVVKGGEVIFGSTSSGISGFLEAVEKLGGSFEGASVGDRVVGRAVALLCVYVKVRAVYAVTLSERGKSVFEKYGICHKWGRLVKSILDMGRSGMCPFERLASQISDPEEAYLKLRELQRSLSSP